MDTWDFGVSAPRTALRHRYTITNNSSVTWTVKHVTPSCTCTCGEFSSRTVKPSESTSVEVVFQAGERDGSVYQAVMVEFAESTAPFFQLAMKGEIRGLLSPSPPSVDFGRVWAVKRLSRSVDLRNYGERDLTITRIETPDWLQAEIQPIHGAQPAHAPRQTWKIALHADVSRFNAAGQEPKLVIHTDAATIGAVVIPVRLEKRPPLEVIPNGLDFRTVPVGGSSQQMLVVDVSPELGDLNEKDLVLTHHLGEELKIRVLKTGSQNRFRLIALYQPKRPAGAVQGELQIQIREKAAPAVRIPISALVR